MKSSVNRLFVERLQAIHDNRWWRSPRSRFGLFEYCSAPIIGRVASWRVLLLASLVRTYALCNSTVYTRSLILNTVHTVFRVASYNCVHIKVGIVYCCVRLVWTECILNIEAQDSKSSEYQGSAASTSVIYSIDFTSNLQEVCSRILFHGRAIALTHAA